MKLHVCPACLKRVPVRKTAELQGNEKTISTPWHGYTGTSGFFAQYLTRKPAPGPARGNRPGLELFDMGYLLVDIGFFRDLDPGKNRVGAAEHIKSYAECDPPYGL